MCTIDYGGSGFTAARSPLARAAPKFYDVLSLQPPCRLQSCNRSLTSAPSSPTKPKHNGLHRRMHGTRKHEMHNHERTPLALHTQTRRTGDDETRCARTTKPAHRPAALSAVCLESAQLSADSLRLHLGARCTCGSATLHPCIHVVSGSVIARRRVPRLASYDSRPIRHHMPLTTCPTSKHRRLLVCMTIPHARLLLPHRTGRPHKSLGAAPSRTSRLPHGTRIPHARRCASP